ncbi:related to acetylornithine aminotransferase precursor [Melanopsichium pennsylvanicum]|uniref:Related to acetylornithine aminotransferase n=2 Tax=Melanopsichium pennsylvanicum TaxID=63383 RepID=A0AAJ4XS19_9BASI|nr:related to acetylornithine aminotransferase precursor [Melanopsichium pennsylvanicum 4]SNX86841.1 related to acetylornithine aminotransferase precursor [Melanopsichium pennsylvanicum]
MTSTRVALSSTLRRPTSSIALRPFHIRLLATHATRTTKKPCADYISLSHPDGDASRGSKIADTLDRFSHSVLATYSRPQLIFTRGNGLDLYAAADPNNNSGHTERKYLDFSSGIAVNSLGHADKQIADIAAEQSAKLVHASNLYHNEWSGELADRMVNLTHQHGGMGFAKGQAEKKHGTAGLKVFLANSGTEANEAALKFARKAAKAKGGDKRTALVSFNNAFHGRTMGALAMTPNPKYQAPFAPLIGDVRTGIYNDIAGLESLIDDTTAGVIVEPVQGEGGIFPASLEFLTALRKRCDEVGAMLIFDEIQCGLFRAGTLWCHSEYPVEAHPDMVTMAKPLANGFPIGAVLMRDRVAELIAVGDHGTTFGGGPLTSRIAHHVLGRLSSNELGESMKESSSALFARLKNLVGMFPDLLLNEPENGKPSPRGKGLIVGVSTKDPAHAGKVVQLARQRGLLILTAGSDTIRILPSLTVTREQVDKAVDIIESCLLVVRDEVQRSASASTCASASASSSTIDAKVGQQVRAFSTSTRAFAVGTSNAEHASAQQIQQLYKSFVDLGQSWPKDPLRPEIDFGSSVIAAAQTALLSVQSQAALHPEQVQAKSPGDPLPNPLPGTKTLTKHELEYASQSFKLLTDLKENKVHMEYPLPESMLKPKSQPEYYDRLIKSIERAVEGKIVAPGLGERIKRFFGRT